MSFLGNILWFVFAGFWLGLSWLFIGFLWCITIVGIPVGVQCFKLAGMAFFPFGKQVVYDPCTISCLLNVAWMVFGGVLIAAGSFLVGLIMCITIVGIPFGLQCFKLARLAFMPFGARVVQG